MTAPLVTLGCLTLERPLFEDEVERLQGALVCVRNMLIEAAATFCRDGADMNTYADGRSVESVVELELGNIYRHRWHPQRDHYDNRPHTLLASHECTSGARRSVLVAADQVLDVVDARPALRLIRQLPSDERTALGDES